MAEPTYEELLAKWRRGRNVSAPPAFCASCSAELGGAVTPLTTCATFGHRIVRKEADHAR